MLNTVRQVTKHDFFEGEKKKKKKPLGFLTTPYRMSCFLVSAKELSDC